jgi:hypothetical protein
MGPFTCAGIALTASSSTRRWSWFTAPSGSGSLWSNRAALDIEYTADFAAYAGPGQGHYWLYRFLESSGLGDF